MSTQDGHRALRKIPFSSKAKTAGIRLSALLGAAAVLAACGADADGGTCDAGASADSAVRTEEHPTLGAILVDRSGSTLYFTDQEADGTIRCISSCLKFWIPATSADGSAPLAPDVTGVDTVRRSDVAQTQLTYQGKPLYTFAEDEAAGDVTGDNLADDFGGTHFVWHAVTIDEIGTATTAPEPDPNGGGY